MIDANLHDLVLLMVQYSEPQQIQQQQETQELQFGISFTKATLSRFIFIFSPTLRVETVSANPV